MNDDEIVKLYRELRSIRKVAARAGLSYSTVRRIIIHRDDIEIERRGAPGGERHWNMVDPVERAKLRTRCVELYEDRSIANVAREVRRSYAFVRTLLHEAGIQMHRQGVHIEQHIARKQNAGS